MSTSIKSVIKVEIATLLKGRENIPGLKEDLKAFQKTLIEVQTTSKKAFGALASECSAIGVAFATLTQGISGLAQNYNSFDKSMRAVNTMASKNAADLGVLTNQVRGLSKEIPMAREALADGLYQVISNGVPEDNWLSFLEKSAKSAVGGMADLGGVVTVTSTILKNYGLAWEYAGLIQDKIQMTAKNGVTSFEQLQQALPRVTGNAATLGVSIDELMASFATLTGVSGNTAEVSTQIAAIFTALVKPSSQAADMAQKMGIRFDAAAIKASGGFHNFLTNLQASVSEYSKASGVLEQEVYGKLFGSAESLRALIPLTGELASKYEENVAAMAGATGAIDTAYKEMRGSAEDKAQILQNAVSSITDFVGKAAAMAQPILQFVAIAGQAISGVTMLVGGLISLGKATASVTKTVYEYIAAKIALIVQKRKSIALDTILFGLYVKEKVATLALAGAHKAAAAAAATWAGIQKVLNLVLTANPIGVVITAIGGLVAAVVAAYKNFEGFRQLCDKVWAAVKPLATAIIGGVGKAFEYVAEKARIVWEWIKNIFGLGGKKVEVEVDVKPTPSSLPELDFGNVEAPAASTTTTNAKSKDKEKRELVGDIEILEDRISKLQEKLKQAIGDEAINAIQKELAGLQKELDKKQTYKEDPVGDINQLQEKIDDARERLNASVGLEAKEAINKDIEKWQRMLDYLQNYKGAPDAEITTDATPALEGTLQLREKTDEAAEAQKRLREQMGLIGGAASDVGSVFSSLGSIIGGAAGAMLDWASKTMQAIAQVLPQIATLITAKQGEAMAGATASGASLPPPFNIISIAAGVAAVLAQFAAIPKFAQGGIAYGPTLGLFGEYAGASNNPEVVAPLDKLRDLIAPQQAVYGDVRFIIEGDKLVGVLDRRLKRIGRT